MAVLQMQRINICTLKKNRKAILELLQRKGVIEISDTMPEDSVFQKTDVTATETSLMKNIALANEALEVLNIYAKEETGVLSTLNGRKELLVGVYDDFYKEYDDVLLNAKKICNLSKKIKEEKSEILKIEAQLETLTPWLSLDLPFSFKGTRCTSAFIGVLQNEWTLEKIYEQIPDDILLHVEIVYISKDQTCLFALCLKEQSDKVLECLRSIGFSHKTSASIVDPQLENLGLVNQIESAKKSLAEAEEEIKSLSEVREKIKFLMDYETMRSEKYNVIGQLLQSKSVLVLSGYIPKKESVSIEDTLKNRFEVVVELEEPNEEEDVPVLLENNAFSSPLESTVEGFSLPGKGEVDPTFMMSLFYYMLFGLMLSDAAYGAIMVLGCGIALAKFKTMEKPLKKTLKMYLYCGISTVFWGILFGSYFGDVVDVVSSTFFGKQITIPALWFVPVNEPMRMLVFAMLLGVIHLYAGLGIKLYQCVRDKKYLDALYDVVFWYVLLTSCIVLLLSAEMFVNIVGLSFILPPIAAKIAGILAVLSAIGILLTSGRESKNPFKRFLKGLYGLYGISGYLSDVLSYSRLLALGLATGVICTVINKMGAMSGGGIKGAIIFTLVFILGHSLNIGINALGAYVHTNRLQYVEFFGKFYEGGGRKFQPFSVKTKYFKFKEKTNNE